MSDTIDMSKLVDLTGIAKVRNWVRNNFLLKTDAEKMMASKIKLTFGSDFVGQTYTVTGGANESYTGVVPEIGIVEITIKELDSVYTVTCTSTEGTNYEREITIGNYYGKYPMEFFSFLAYLHIKADPGATITATIGGKNYTGTTDNTGYCTLNVGKAGTYSVTASLNGETTSAVTVDVSVSGETYECICPSLLLNIVSFADGTDDEIAAMLDAAKNGSIDLQTDGGWAVGDTRTIKISAFTGGGNVNHIEQDIDIVISSFEDYNGCGAKMQFDFKQSLKTGNRMNASNTNSGGYKASEMFTTTLPNLVKALPAWLSERLLEFAVKASAGSQSSTIETITGNKLALRSEVEIFGSTTYSKSGEGTQIEYYKTAANRKKTYGKDGSAGYWWERSPSGSSSSYFCIVHSDGTAGNRSASNTYGVSPFGCI